MKITEKCRLFPLLSLCVLLASCTAAGRAEDLMLDFREKLVNASAIKLEAELRADYGDAMWDFTLSLESAEGENTVTVLSPENIAGVSATVDEGSALLRYDGAELTTGTVGGTTPMGALPMMAELWKNGCVSECCVEGEELILTFAADGGVTHRLRCSAESLTPISAELISGGKTVITCEFRSFTLE